ncbi:MAG: hypothetical protein WBW48_03080, partial [Anaerolineae bacterium]
SAVFGIPATRVFGRNSDFTEPNCLANAEDPICGPWEPAFDSRGRMVIGFNGYLGLRFLMVYQDPLTNPMPIAALGDFHSMPFSARFDQFDNLYILDGNRSRILIYRNREVTPTSTATPTATSTPTATDTPTPRPTSMPTPTPTAPPTATFTPTATLTPYRVYLPLILRNR